VKVTDVSILPSREDPLKLEGKVTCEVDVTPDMCNERGVLAQGCIVTLLDEGTNLSMSVASAAEGRLEPGGVSQIINVLFHAPATVDVKLRLVHSSMASDSQTNSARSEIWDTTNHRLVASGTQLAMLPSKIWKNESQMSN
jgi:acyl-coenzyme A thioesterase 13